MCLERLANILPRLWFTPKRALAPSNKLLLLLLCPLSWVFSALVCVRRLLYRTGIFASVRVSVPVIVVGNITVGGSGKTPLVLWVVNELKARGWQPGIISRGYGGTLKGGETVSAVSANSTADEVGDEPLQLFRQSGAPVFVGRDRVAAARALLHAHPACTILVSDDGLQHYRLQRSFEIVVFDARGAGNANLLPAGPLREPLSRLKSADALVFNLSGESEKSEESEKSSLKFLTLPAFSSLQMTSAIKDQPQFAMTLHGERFFKLSNRAVSCSAAELRGKNLIAVAGIGDPQRFFSQLDLLGLQFSAHPFPDHHRYSQADFSSFGDGILVMTEKDAVKCANLTLNQAWVLPVEANCAPLAGDKALIDLILEKQHGRTALGHTGLPDL